MYGYLVYSFEKMYFCTGSLLGVRGYGKSDNGLDDGQDSVPVGYETVVEMHPLDFEEFLWANGINDKVIDLVKSCFENETPFLMVFTR